MAIMVSEEEFAERIAEAVQAERERCAQVVRDLRDAAFGRAEWREAQALEQAVSWMDAVPAPPPQTTDDEDAEIAVQQLRHAPHPVLGVPRD